ncbi:MAG: FAD-dependent oxidoreductase [Candidatus Aramenus sp.]|jgi:hypothetical protein|nr:FAD-dependent oxidoreductase [Candidatus Aramenus sp.]
MKCVEEAKPLEKGFPYTYSKFDTKGLFYLSVRDEEELSQRVTECVEEGVPIIPLGYGTTNFSQLKPRRRPSVYLDVTGLKGIIDEGKDWVEVYPGNRVGELLRYLRKQGKDLPVYPSSFEISSIGGFVEGGSGGPGSFNYGPHFKVLSKEVELITPRGGLKLSGRGALGVTHACGTTGVLKRVKVNAVEYVERKLQYVEVSEVKELREMIAKMFKQREKFNLVSVYNKQGFKGTFREEANKNWVVVFSSALELGSSLSVDDRFSFATSFAVNTGKRWYVMDLELEELESLEEVRDKGAVHGEVVNLGEPTLLVDVFSEKMVGMRENVNEKVRDHLLRFKGYGREVLEEIVELKARADPMDVFNPGKLI